MSCTCAWRRAVFETQYREHSEAGGALEDARKSLALYCEAAGGVSPFANAILSVPLGELDEDLFLLGLYRMDVAASIAWALHLMDEIPPLTSSSDAERIASLFPLDGGPGWTRDDVCPRDPPVLKQVLDEWRSTLAAARTNRDGSEERELEFSRAYERTRGLKWVCTDLPWVEDVEPN